MTRMRPFLFLGVLATLLVGEPAGVMIALGAVAINEFVAAAGDLRTRRVALRPRLRLLTAWLGRLAARVVRRRTGRGRTRFASYDKVRSDLAWAQYSRRDFDMAMRRRLLNAAAVRLRHECGLDLDHDPVRARRLLGERAWSVLRPADEASQDRFTKGVSLPDLEHVVDAIEGLTKENA